MTALVNSPAVRPKPDKLEDPKEDTNDVNSGLDTMLSLNKAQKRRHLQILRAALQLMV